MTLNQLAPFLLILLFCGCSDIDIAYRINESDLIPEGIAYSQATGHFYLSSMHKSKIIKLDENTGVHSDFITSGEYGFLSGLGLAVDDTNRELWAICSDLNPQQCGSMIFVFDLLTGNVRRKFAPVDTLNHFFNDLVLDKQGNTYVTDSDNHSIYMISATDGMSLFLKSEQIIYPNGITISDDDQYLFVASFLRGVRVIDIDSRTIVNQADTTDLSRGIDGLKYFQNSLIAVQNGFQTKERHRIMRYYLNASGTEITASEIITANNPYFDIPTTAVINGGILYTIANSQLRNLDQQQNRIPDVENLKPVVILKHSLRK